MKDRIPTQVLTNGALRYGIYDANGNLLRYEYILPADEPTETGTPLTKATMLSDAAASILGLTQTNPTVNDAFASLGNVSKIAYGTYTGTGTIGEANPNIITASFNVLLGVVVSVTGSYMAMFTAGAAGYAFGGYVDGSTFQNFTQGTGTVISVDNGLSWYSDKVRTQMNINGTEYAYVLFGMEVTE